MVLEIRDHPRMFLDVRTSQLELLGPNTSEMRSVQWLGWVFETQQRKNEEWNRIKKGFVPRGDCVILNSNHPYVTRSGFSPQRKKERKKDFALTEKDWKKRKAYQKSSRPQYYTKDLSIKMILSDSKNLEVVWTNKDTACVRRWPGGTFVVKLALGAR